MLHLALRIVQLDYNDSEHIHAFIFDRVCVATRAVTHLADCNLVIRRRLALDIVLYMAAAHKYRDRVMVVLVQRSGVIGRKLQKAYGHMVIA